MVVMDLDTKDCARKHGNELLPSGNNDQKQDSSNKSSMTTTTRLTRRYYVDELGFYRYLDPEQEQYVCSNINSINLRASSSSEDGRQMGKISNNDSCHEVCFKEIRRDLGISHFDRIEDHDNWKRGWDNFMRAKLISQQPILLNRELKNRVRSGIPHDYRCKVWSALIRMRTRNIRVQFGEDIYEAIVRDFVSKVEVPDYSSDNPNKNGKYKGTRTNRSSYMALVNDQGPSILNGTSSSRNKSAPSRPNNGYSSQRPLTQQSSIDKCFKQIELDLLRTLPNNRHFEHPNSRGTQRVRRVLRAYACFNQTVGYCQGMNRLAAMALLVLPEEEAFWCLVAIIQCIMPKDYYLKPWLAQVDCCVLSDLLEKKMPKLHKHLVKNDIQLTLFTWFFTIFVDGFRPELMLRIWDCFLLEGDKVLFRFALAILHIAQDDLLKMNDFSTMSTHLSRLASTRKLDVEHLFESK